MHIIWQGTMWSSRSRGTTDCWMTTTCDSPWSVITREKQKGSIVFQLHITNRVNKASKQTASIHAAQELYTHSTKGWLTTFFEQCVFYKTSLSCINAVVYLLMYTENPVILKLDVDQDVPYIHLILMRYISTSHHSVVRTKATNHSLLVYVLWTHHTKV